MITITLAILKGGIMQKKTRRDSVMYVHIQKVNHDWVKSQMKKLKYTSSRGKSEFVDQLISNLRNKKAAP